MVVGSPCPDSVAPGRLHGRHDGAPDLSDGAAIAALAAALPEGAHWVTSPLRRAVETATALAVAAARPRPAAEREADLMEQDFGDWEGRPYDRIDPAFWDAPATNRPPGGESFADVVDRVSALVLRLSAVAERDIVAVAHAGVIRAALAQALRCPPAGALRFAIDPLSTTRLDIFSGATPAWRVVFTNRPAWPLRIDSVWSGFGADGPP